MIVSTVYQNSSTKLIGNNVHRVSKSYRPGKAAKRPELNAMIEFRALLCPQPRRSLRIPAPPHRDLSVLLSVDRDCGSRSERSLSSAQVS